MIRAPHGLTFGFKTPQEHTTYAELRDLWLAADSNPAYGHGWLFDHFRPMSQPPLTSGDGTYSCFEAWTLLAALAAITTRLEIGVMVTGNTYRHPAVLAQMLGTVYHISGGRASLGFGAGWDADEHRGFGMEMPPHAERIDRWAEACQVISELCDKETVDFTGRFYRLKGATLSSRPARRPRFVLGGRSPRAMTVIARYADIWNVVGGSFADLQRGKSILADECRRINRDPSEIIISVQLHSPADDLRTTRKWVDLYLRAGVRHIVFELIPPYRAGIIDQLADEVIYPVSEEAKKTDE